MRLLGLLLLLASLLNGCAGNQGKASDQAVANITTTRQAEAGAFKAKFTPLLERLKAQVNAPDYGSAAEGESLKNEFEKLGSAGPDDQIHNITKRICQRCSLAAGDVEFYHSPYIDAELKATTSAALERFKQNPPDLKDLEHFASEERVRRELEAKPIPPESIKIGAKLSNPETGKVLGYVTNPEYHKGSEILVVVVADRDRPEQGELYFDRYQVQRGIDFQIEP